MPIRSRRLPIVYLLAVLPVAALAQTAGDGALPLPGPADAAASASGLLPVAMTPWGMFTAADIVVQAVMVSLAFASLVTWTVLAAKSVELAGAMRRQRVALAAVDGAHTLADAAGRIDDGTPVAAALIAAAAIEARMSADALADRDGLKERIASRLQRIEAAAARRIVVGTGLLATIGATAPFVGLFGTVCGIMNSFVGIAEAQTTNLAVVAPGIAEALLATALGLVAAIPAVVIYNHFTRRIAAWRALVGDTAAAVLRLASRDLSRGAFAAVDPRRAAE